MTFYEAALQILLREGRPLHATEITELALKENLLSHVGKQPEAVMASRLAAMARRSHDRRLVAVEPDTFALVDWNVSPDPEALGQSGLPEEHEEEEPLRDRERHPRIAKDKARIAGRGERRRKEEVERRRRRPLSLPGIVAEILERMHVPVPLFDLAALIRETDLVSDDLGREALANQLRGENGRREEEGQDSLFTFPDGGLVGLFGWPPSTPEMFEVAPPLEEVVAQVATDRRPSAAAAPAPAAAAAAAAAPVERLQAEYRQQAIRALRKRLLELDAPALEAVSQNLLDGMGYRGTRIAKRHKDGALFTTRRRMGLVEVRFAIRVLRGGKDVRREDVSELRKDLSSHSAQVGVILSPADPTREARSEASRPGQSLILLLCADALAEQLAERGVGVSRQQVTLDVFDPSGLDRLIGGQQGRARGREERERRPREEREERERRPREEREERERRPREEREERELRPREEREERERGPREEREERERRPRREREKRERRGRRDDRQAADAARDEATPDGLSDAEGGALPEEVNLPAEQAAASTPALAAETPAEREHAQALSDQTPEAPAPLASARREAAQPAEAPASGSPTGGEETPAEGAPPPASEAAPPQGRDEEERRTASEPPPSPTQAQDQPEEEAAGKEDAPVSP